jgi:hypothetical protein
MEPRRVADGAIRKAAGGSELKGDQVRLARDGTDSPYITIRRAGAADGESLVRLAGLDSKHVPPGTFLIAEIDGEQWAAVALESGEALADPFRHTADIVEMLQLRAARIRELESPDLVRKRGFAAAAGRLLPGRRRRAAAESRA